MPCLGPYCCKKKKVREESMKFCFVVHVDIYTNRCISVFLRKFQVQVSLQLMLSTIAYKGHKACVCHGKYVTERDRRPDYYSRQIALWPSCLSYII